MHASEEDLSLKSPPKKRKTLNKGMGKEKATIKCEICNIGPMTPTIYQLHYEKHHDTTVYKCKICDKEVISKYKLRTHKHNKGKKGHIRCQICNAGPMTIEKNRLHYDRHHDKSVYKCEICGREIVSMCKFRKHKLHSHERLKEGYTEEVFLCDGCPKTLACKQSLREHKLKFHNHIVQEDVAGPIKTFLPEEAISKRTGKAIIANVKCQLCKLGNETYMTPEKYQNHYDKFHDQTVYQCDLCPSSVISKWKYVRHRRRTHDFDPNHLPYMCDFCPKAFRHRQSIKVHLLTHDETYVQPSLNCEICGKLIKKKAMMNHMRLLHTNKGEALPCPQCGKVFNNEFRLKKHVKFVHVKADSEECEICGRKFPSPQNLRKHIDGVHKKLKPFQCKLCGHFFSQTSSLNLHLKGVHKVDKSWNIKTDITENEDAENEPQSPGAPSSYPYVKLETSIPSQESTSSNETC